MRLRTTSTEQSWLRVGRACCVLLALILAATGCNRFERVTEMVRVDAGSTPAEQRELGERLTSQLSHHELIERLHGAWPELTPQQLRHRVIFSLGPTEITCGALYKGESEYSRARAVVAQCADAVRVALGDLGGKSM